MSNSTGNPEPRKPLHPVELVSTNNPLSDVIETHWTANWFVLAASIHSPLNIITTRRKPQTKKHQTWDGDAYVSQTDGKLVMVSEDGKL